MQPDLGVFYFTFMVKLQNIGPAISISLNNKSCYCFAPCLFRKTPTNLHVVTLNSIAVPLLSPPPQKKKKKHKLGNHELIKKKDNDNNNDNESAGSISDLLFILHSPIKIYVWQFNWVYALTEACFLLLFFFFSCLHACCSSCFAENTSSKW